MTIYKLRVVLRSKGISAPQILETFFTNEQDAHITVKTTWSKCEDKPTYTVEPIDVLERETHL